MRASTLTRHPPVEPYQGGAGGGGGGGEGGAPPRRESRPMPAHDFLEPSGDDWGTSTRLTAVRQLLDKLVAQPRTALQRSVAALWARHAAHQVPPADARSAALLASVRQLCEAHWKKPVIPAYVAERLFARELFCAWKALDLLRSDRTPQEVIEGFVRAEGAVGEHPVVTRDVFWQRFAPQRASRTGYKPSGRVVLIVPGLGETGRHFLAQIDELTRLGHEVVTMDQQWAGQTRNSDETPTTGALDRGFGAARDVAAVGAMLHRHLRKGQKLVLMGQGTGATAVLMMLVAAEAGLLPVSVPRGLDAMLQAPFLAPRQTSTNRLLSLLGRLPLSRSLRAASLLPRPTSDEAAAAEYAACMRREGANVLLGTLAALRDDLRTTWELMAQGHRPSGRLVVLHAADDPWADPSASQRLSGRDALGRHASIRILFGAHHALAQVPSERGEALWALHKLGVDAQPAEERH